MAHKIFNTEQINFILIYYPLYGSEWCSKKIPFTKKQITKKASLLKIKVLPEVKTLNNSISHIGKNHWSNVDEIFFISPVSQEAAYILGLLWADGFINKTKNRISLEMLYDDLVYLEDFFKISGKWTKIIRQRSNRRKQMTFRTSNYHLWIKLKHWGYLNRNLGADKIIDELPDHLLPAFLRGLFDGDGCYYVNVENSTYQFSVGGCYDQNWEFLQKIFDKLNINYTVSRRIHKNGNTSSIIRLANRKNIITLGEYIYKDATCYLPRKYNKYKEIKQSFIDRYGDQLD